MCVFNAVHDIIRSNRIRSILLTPTKVRSKRRMTFEKCLNSQVNQIWMEMLSALYLIRGARGMKKAAQAFMVK